MNVTRPHVGPILAFLLFTGVPAAVRADELTAAPGLRLRTHMGDAWVGPRVPSFIPHASGDLRIDLLDHAAGAWVALYRSSFEHCGLGEGDKNCPAEVRVFDDAGATLASVPLLPLMSRPTHLEVQDVRYDDGVLYFNEACQSYAREAGGRCSSLVAYDTRSKRVLWRTGPLVSNNWFLVAGKYVVAAYGFTGEPAFVRLVRRSDGKVVETKALPHTNFEMNRNGDVVSVDVYYAEGRVNFRLSGDESDAPHLERQANTPAPTWTKPPQRTGSDIPGALPKPAPRPPRPPLSKPSAPGY